MARDRTARPEAKPIRLFIAVDVPADVKDQLFEWTRAYRDGIPGARWTQPSGWHVTLKFLGSTWPRLEPTVKEAVAQVARSAAPFQTATTEIGIFPSPRRARVVWAGLSDPGEVFGAMVKQLDELLSGHFVAEKRSFTPHLTLARLGTPRDISEFAPGLVGSQVSSRRFEVEELVLYRSHLSPKGATYEPLERAALADAGSA